MTEASCGARLRRDEEMEEQVMAINFMDLLGAMTQGGMTASSGSRMQTAGGGIQDLLGGLMGGGQSLLGRAGQAVGGGDNLAAAGLGALLGSLSGGKSNTSLGGLGGGLMGLLGMMAFKALKNAGQNPQPMFGMSAAQGAASPQALENNAELIITAMIDAAKADGQVDANELNRITSKIKATGVGQEGMNYIISKLQAPMATDKIVAAVRGRPELAAQIYSASLMAIEVDTAAERNYLNSLAKAMGLPAEVARNIEQLVGMQAA